jgi:hypothetical protein
VRGEARRTSDVDLLIVLGDGVPIRRDLYTAWDKQVMPALGEKYSPQFSHVPKGNVSSLWLEVALEGQIDFDPHGRVRQVLYKIKEEIASGRYRRKISHGHPYWVKIENAE